MPILPELFAAQHYPQSLLLIYREGLSALLLKEL